MIQHQTVRQRKAIKKIVKQPSEIVNNALYTKAWREKGSDFAFTRLGLILIVLFALTMSASLTPFRENFVAYLTTGVVESWWSIIGYISISAIIFLAFVFINGKIDRIVRRRVDDHYLKIQADYWEALKEQENSDE